MADTQDSSTTQGAKDSQTAKKAKEPKEPRDKWSFTRSTLPYLIAAVLASALMAWYFLVFVPAKLDYFVGLRFRTLAVAGGHVKSNAENLAKAFGSAVKAGNELRTYLATLVPSIQLESTARLPSGLRLYAFQKETKLAATVAWPDVMVQAAATSRRDFDDLLLADADGRVQWQRELSTPRIGNLSELLGAKDVEDSWTFSWNVRTTTLVSDDVKHLRATAMLKPVVLGGTSCLLLVQPVEPSVSTETEASQRRLYVAGVVSRAALQRQAMRVPAAWLVMFALPVMVLFLALPFLKLATLTPRERYRFADVVLLAVATIAAAGLGAVLPFVSGATNAVDRTLLDFANRLEQRLKCETDSILRLGRRIVRQNDLVPRWCVQDGSALEKFDNTLEISTATTRPPSSDDARCGLWQALGEEKPQLELDVAIWFDRQGEQTRKWTTKRRVTGPASHRNFAHFRELTEDDLWEMPVDQDQERGEKWRFIIDPVRAPTTAELGVLFAMRLEDMPGVSGKTSPTKHSVPSSSEPAFFGLNVRPQSVVDPVVPPGYGFAIIAPDGRVLFHSSEDLSLEENFFAEVGNPADVRARAQAGRIAQWSGDYHGRPHRLCMKPVKAFINCPWLIVTFEELDPVLAMEVLEQAGTLRLGALNLGVLILVAAILSLVIRLRRLRCRDLLLTGTQLREDVLWALPALTVVGILAIAATFVDAAHRWVDTLYAVFSALPLLAILAAVGARYLKPEKTEIVADGDQPRSRNEKDPDKPQLNVRGLIRAELGLLVLLVSAIPAIGFARVVQIVQDSKTTERWLDTVELRWHERQARQHARVMAPNYHDETRRRVQKENAFAAKVIPLDTTRNFSYLGILERVSAPQERAPAISPETGQELLRFVLEWNPFASKERPARLEVLQSATTHEFHLKTTSGMTAMVRPGGFRRPSWWAVVLGLLILISTLVALYWAHQKLRPRPVVAAPCLKMQVTAVRRTGNAIVLLIGPPQTGKDRAACSAVRDVTGRSPIERIRLLHKQLSDKVIEEHVRTINIKIGRATTASRGPRSPFWIHLSNLETQLVDQSSRRQVLHLFERLLESQEPPRALIVTTSVDPIAHFRELFAEERKCIYTDAIPEVELGHSALLMSRFIRCYLPFSSDLEWLGSLRWKYDPKAWKRALRDELRGYPALRNARRELRLVWLGKSEVGYDKFIEGVGAKAAAHYEFLWTNCTRNEKLVLVQLAEEGFVTAHSQHVVAPLIARGLIVERPTPAIFNRSFADFLRDIERSDVIQEWERMEGNGLWVMASRLIGSSLVAGGIFFLLTQDFSLQSLLPLASGTGMYGAPLIRTLLARMSARPQGVTTA